MTLKSNARCPYQRKAERDRRHTEDSPCEDTCRDWHDAAPSQRTLMPPEARTGTAFSPGTSRENMSLWTPWFGGWPPSRELPKNTSYCFQVPSLSSSGCISHRKSMPVLDKHHLGVFYQLESPLLTTLKMNNIKVPVRSPCWTSSTAPRGHQDVTHICSDGLVCAYLSSHTSHLSPLLPHAAFMLQPNQPVFYTSSCFACLCPFAHAISFSWSSAV